MKKIITPLLLCSLLGSLGILAGGSASAQTGVGTTNPDSHTMLDVVSTQKGLLLPRLNSAEQTTLAAILTSAETGMLIRDSITGKALCWTGTIWKDASGLPLTATSPLNISALDTIALNPGTLNGDLITWDGDNWVNMQPATQHFSITVDNRQPFLVINYCIALQGIFPSRNSSEPFLGEIEMYGFNFAPKGFAQCNGQLLAISQNTALFSLVGTYYGGNGTSTFALPNFQGRAAMHMSSNYLLGQTGGSESATLSK